MEQRRATVELLRRVIGRRLDAVTEARHWYAGRRDGDAESLVHFWLHFEGVPPVMAHSTGEHLLLEFAEPYASYDMREYGETRVEPAQPPDVLAAYKGQLLLNVAPIQGYSSEPSAGGVQLRFEHEDLVVVSLGDEWLLTQGPVPAQFAAYLTVGDWLVSQTGK
ncbi:hypothetical protein KZZ52_55575 [Dactylosporangium sp. AC04546]|uniref:hypothetical protein n=1 Tax=Dactylosporangium sp. AC04546 TaxID=2862460 RepID=UPI001EDF6C8B|nr:hypothetical protein [Dactylosporangium sp. AC04546]WVK83048.1 hypothetical protein KZZ52_55575 [Dactylosporangium sp. AC04546]